MCPYEDLGSPAPLRLCLACALRETVRPQPAVVTLSPHLDPRVASIWSGQNQRETGANSFSHSGAEPSGKTLPYVAPSRGKLSSETAKMARTARARKLSRDTHCSFHLEATTTVHLARETALARPGMPLLDRFFAPSFTLLFSFFRARALQNHRFS